MHSFSVVHQSKSPISAAEWSNDDAVADPFDAGAISPTEAYQATLALFHRVAVEAAWRRVDELPGLAETLQERTLLRTGRATRRTKGWFAEWVWRYGDRRVHEVFLNADRRTPHPSVDPAEDVLVTLLHECCHVWAQVNGIRDTSRGGRWHNRRFAEVALAIGLAVERDAVIGHRTPSLSSSGRADYADLLRELEAGLILAREPQLRKAVTKGPNSPVSTATGAPLIQPKPEKFVFASCRCRNAQGRPVTIRVARGSWRSGAIRCSVCNEAFAESLTEQRQDGYADTSATDRKER